LSRAALPIMIAVRGIPDSCPHSRGISTLTLSNTAWYALAAPHFCARQHYMLSALYAIDRLSVRPSVTRVDQSKTVEVKIIKFSGTSSSFCGVNFIQKF